MSNLQIFNNPEFGDIRTVTIDGEPWFVGKDVAVALGYSNHRDALYKHVDSEDKGESRIATPSGEQTMTIINESGLYALIFGSKLESAKRFKRWVTSEVLPAIRKTGNYSVAPQRDLTKDDYIKAASMVSSCRNERLPYVLGFLEQAGFKIPEVEQMQEKQPEEGMDLERLSDMINRSSMSLNKLSELTNICKASLSYYKNRKCKPSPERYAVLIQVLS